MRFYVILLMLFFSMIVGNVFAQYGEHGKPRMLLIQTHSDLTPPNEDESDKIRDIIKQSSIAKEIKQEDFMYAKASYTVFVNVITPVAMQTEYYDDLKARLKLAFPRVSFQEIEFETAYKWLGKSPRAN